MKKYLAISLGIHLGFMGFLNFFKSSPKTKETPANPSTKDDFKGKIMIVDVDPRFKSKKAPKTGRLAKQNQTTKKETVAPNNPGVISGGDGFGSAPKSITTKGKGEQKPKGKGVSSSDDFIEGAEIGPMTILNAQEFKYFSYYERIKERIVENWRPLIRKAIRTVKSDPKKYGTLTEGLKTTKLELTLNKKGEVLSLTLKQSSGFKLFDDAAEKAFRQSAPFSSPPKDLVKDGVFELRWDFSVQVQEAGLVQFNTGEVKGQ